MKHTGVILCLHDALHGVKSDGIMLRTDNGSQFIAHGLSRYCKSRGITQEFTHVATPEENAYIESLFSCVEKEVIKCYDFESIYHCREVFARYFTWHNKKRKRYALGRKGPLDYWNTTFDSHPVRPPKALSEGFVKGDDTGEELQDSSSLVIPLTNPERELYLHNKVDEKLGKCSKSF